MSCGVLPSLWKNVKQLVTNRNTRPLMRPFSCVLVDIVGKLQPFFQLFSLCSPRQRKRCNYLIFNWCFYKYMINIAFLLIKKQPICCGDSIGGTSRWFSPKHPQSCPQKMWIELPGFEPSDHIQIQDWLLREMGVPFAPIVKQVTFGDWGLQRQLPQHVWVFPGVLFWTEQGSIK